MAAPARVTVAGSIVVASNSGVLKIATGNNPLDWRLIRLFGFPGRMSIDTSSPPAFTVTVTSGRCDVRPPAVAGCVRESASVPGESGVGVVRHRAVRVDCCIPGRRIRDGGNVQGVTIEHPSRCRGH